MSAPVISSVVPPVLPRQRIAESDSASPALARRSLPLPALIPARTTRLIYGLAAIDDRGRLADRIVMRALGWQAGHRLNIAETKGVLTVHADPHGTHQVTGQGHLRIPAALRHRCALATGDRVLLAADPGQSRLSVYPPAALDHALAQPADTTGGEPA